MGNFEKLSVLVIVVIIVMILVVALYTWTDSPDEVPAQRETVSAGRGTAAANDPGSGGAATSVTAWPDLYREDPVEPVVGPNPPRVTVEDPPAPRPDLEKPAAPGSEDPTVASEWTYSVKSGDTLSQIAERELFTHRRQKEIMALNPTLDALSIREGQTVRMPARGTKPGSEAAPKPGEQPAPHRGSITAGEHYVIQRGDTLESIAKRAWGKLDRWPELWARNLSVVSSADDLPVGAKLFVPK